MISEFLLQTDLKRYRKTGKANTVFGLTSNGESVLNGRKAMHMPLKLWPIIEEKG